MFTGISSRFSVLSNESSPPDKVNFTNTIPEIVSNTINSLYTDEDPSDGKILDIEVKNEAYQLIAPNASNGIKFHFYDGATLVASTGSYDFVNSSGGSNKSYPILLSEVTPVAGGDYLVNDKEYRIKAEVTLTTGEKRLSELDVTNPLSDKVNFSIKYPVISTISSYDFQNDGNNGNSVSQVIASILVPHQSYELVAPTKIATSVSGGIRFLIYDSNELTLVARTIYYDFVNSGASAVKQYDIKLNELNFEAGNKLSNGLPGYRVKAEVTIVEHSGDQVPRVSQDFDDLKGTQDVVALTSVTISNSWALATNDNPSSSPERFNASPLIGISGYFKKTLQFDPDNYTRHLDIATTKFKIEYKVGNAGSWQDVQKGVLLQRLAGESIAAAVGRANTTSPESVTNGKFDNVPSASTPYDNEMIFFIPQVQVPGSAAFTESDKVQVQITIDDSVNIWGSTSGSVTTPTSSHLDSNTSLQIIKKINTYNYVVGQSSEPWNSDTDDSLVYIDTQVNNNNAVRTYSKSSLVAGSSNIITYSREGWRVVNTGNGTKMHLYFYMNEVEPLNQTYSNSFRLSDINGLGMYLVFDHHLGAREYPFIGLYTTATPPTTPPAAAAPGNKAGWYKSRIVYNNNNNSKSALGNTTLDASRSGLTLLYTGTDNPNFRPDIDSSRRVKLDINTLATNTFGNYDNELVNLIAISTDSSASAGKLNFTLKEAGFTTSSSVLNSLAMKFAKNIFLNIPVDWASEHADSVKVGVKYSLDGLFSSYQTFNYVAPPPAQHVSILVDPNQGTTLYYSVAYIVDNVNIGPTAATEGLTAEKIVENKFFPSSTDYTIANTSYKTFNTGGKSSITFDLAFTPASTSGIDGVNVYFTSTDSSITKTRIGSYSSTQGGTGKTIQLLYTDTTINNAVALDNNTKLNVMNSSGTIVTDNLVRWGDFDSASISFEAYRYSRVESTAVYGTTYYVESGSSNFDKTIWNVPKLTKPSADASGTNIYELSGGVINITAGANFHVITWPTASDLNSVPFTYDLTITENEALVVDQDNMSGPSYVIPIDTDETNKYTTQVRKVFNGGSLTNREISDHDTIVFYTAKVDTSSMAVSVQNPSNDSSVTLLWGSPVFTGLSVTIDGSEPASFANNVQTHYIQYRIGESGSYSRLGLSTDPIIEDSSPKTYTLPSNANLGTLFDFVMYIKAQVKFTLNGSVNLSKSTAYSVPLTSVTDASSYIVSTIPSIGLPSTTPVLISGDANHSPTLLLDLNAKGLEDEGFISVVVVLTQDGTANKPEGEQALLVFPGSAGSSFNFTNVLQGSGGGGDVRLIGGDFATSAPYAVNNSNVSTHNNTYTLTIGTKKPDGRFGYSTLSMPSSNNSGFVNSGLSTSPDYNPINYMVILTTRRGTDIKVGQFDYVLPIVTNVYITTTNGEYFVNFEINNI